MTGFVVLVDFRLKPGNLDSFRAMIDANATASVREEEGCQRFDVAQVRGEADRIILYEIYDSEAAFDEHCATPHFYEFDRLSAPLVEAKLVTVCDLVLEPSAGPNDSQ